MNDNNTAYEIIDTPNTSNSFTYVPTNVDLSVFENLKTKINSFVQDHPEIVDRMRLRLSDHFLEHMLKRMFRVQFTRMDYRITYDLLQSFFIEENECIDIIFNYFYHDIHLLFSTVSFENIPWALRKAVIHSPQSVVLRSTKIFLNYKGAEMLTNKTYQGALNPQANLDANTSFDQKNFRLFFFILLFVLLSINIPIIGMMVNGFSVLIFILLIFYYSLQFFK